MPRPEALSESERKAIILQEWINSINSLAALLHRDVFPHLESTGPRHVLDFGPGARGHIESFAARLGLGPCNITFFDIGDFNSAIEVTEVALQDIQASESLSRRSRLSERELKIAYVKGDVYDSTITDKIPPQDVIMAFNIHPRLTASGEHAVQRLVDKLKPNGILVITTAGSEFELISRQVDSLAGVSIIKNEPITPPFVGTVLRETHITIIQRT